MSQFETNPKLLKTLLTQVHAGELALPDFQRDFVWDPSAVEELIESIMRSYPAGSLLLLKHAGQGFEIREFQGAPALVSRLGTSYLVLDGQQRLTSLYQAFYGKGDHLFFLSIPPLLLGSDVEAAVVHESTKRADRLGLTSLDIQAKDLICPLSVVMGAGFDAWIDDVMEIRAETGEAARELRNGLRSVHKKWIQPILDYQFPVISLSPDTSLDAVCKMFETLNRRGVKLTVFELLMARSFANRVSLRSLWDKALSEHRILGDFEIDPVYVLQVVSLLAGHGIKRSEILDIAHDDVIKHWDTAVLSTAEALTFLRRNAGVLGPKTLPYHTLIVPMAAALAKSTQMVGPQAGTRHKKILQWFWASVFSQAYEKGPSSRAVSDYRELQTWLLEDGAEPTALRRLHFNPEMFFEVSHKQRALYRGTMALAVSNGATDFHNGERLTFDYINDSKNGVDDHHIFPQAYLRRKNKSELVNCVLNKTLIDRITNIRISDSPPSTYATSIESEIGTEQLARVLRSHAIDMESLKSDDFETFLRSRARLLMGLLQDKFEHQIPSSMVQSENDDDGVDEDESPDPRAGADLAEINARPSAILDQLPESIGELLDDLTKNVKDAIPGFWWRSRSSRLSLYGPNRMFAKIRLSSTGLHLVVFTDGRPMEGIHPIVQQDRGGELWGRIKLKTPTDRDVVVAALLDSARRIQSAIDEGRPTAWWAVPEGSAKPRPIKPDGSEGANDPLTLTKRLHLEYWAVLRERLLQSGTSLAPRKPLPQNWYNFAMGRTGVQLTVIVHTLDRWIAVCLELTGRDAKRFFQALEAEKEVIEAIAGPLVWQMTEGNACKVSVTLRETDAAVRSNWTRQHQWIQESLEKLHQAFAPRVRTLPHSKSVA